MRIAVMLPALMIGCLGEPAVNHPRPEPAPKGDAPAQKEPTALGFSSIMLSDPPDAGAAPASDMSGPRPDLTGLIDCFGSAVYDPGSMICIKYLNGTPGNPGAPRSAPSCYAPADPCPNGVFDCACIAADPSLSMNCGTCIDNPGGTHTCYN